LIGTVVTLSSPAVAELLSDAGFDWLFIDVEHSPLDWQAAQALLQAARCPCIVRVPLCDEISIKKALDIGADGIIVPQVNSRAEAERVVRYAKYPPLGARGVGVARAQGYGPRFQEYVSRANDEIAVIVQAEHIEAVNHIHDIASVAGIDAVLVGPYDLSTSMGKPGQVTDPEVVQAIARVTAECTACNMPLGIFGMTPDAVQPHIQAGYNLIAIGVDTVLLANSASQIVQQFH
jgi:2-dehydro-3-deoxyglucarate aldolase/4-hydroxy-2-oxoheptanedioate aldolase